MYIFGVYGFLFFKEDYNEEEKFYSTSFVLTITTTFQGL